MSADAMPMKIASHVQATGHRLHVAFEHGADAVINYQVPPTESANTLYTVLLDMLALLKSKADAEGRFTPESIWAAWKDWEFGQKRVPSRWVTLSTWRIIHRILDA